MATAAECDYGHKHNEWNAEIGEIRRLPIGGSANVLMCRMHFEDEMQFRRERINEGVPFKLPEWESLEIYSA